jgi:hypothetical protein
MIQKLTQTISKIGFGLCLVTGLFFGVSTFSASAIEIGDRVWCDSNSNGIQDAGESGVNGVIVELYSCTGEFVMSTTTATGPNGQDGWYLFSSPYDHYGSYYVKFHAPSGATFTSAGQGTGPALDSNANPATGVTACVSAHDLTVDAGIICEPKGPGTGTPGYWANHPNAWPVRNIEIGGISYTKAQAIYLIQSPAAKDKRLTIFPSLVCAKLNVLIGNDDSCIARTITQADAWMTTYGSSAVKASSQAWTIGSPLNAELDAYNNGLLCAPHRD